MKAVEYFIAEKKEEIERLKEALEAADAVVIGAGAGLSTSAGFTYTGKRFYKYFADFIDKYGFSDMYSGGFLSLRSLRKLVEGKQAQVLTTNVDHCFQKAGFDKEKLFYTQGDYGLFQCSVPCHQAVYDNEDAVRAMMKAQGYVLADDGRESESGVR